MGKTTTIRAKVTTRDRLHQLASEAGLSMSDYLDQLACTYRTQAEWDAIAAQDTVYLRQHLGFDPDPDQQTALDARQDALMHELERQHAVRTQRASA